MVRIVEGVEGTVPMRMELVIRFEYGSIVPWVRRVEDETRVAIAGPDALALRTAGPRPRREPPHRRGVHRGSGPASAVRAHLVPVASGDAARDRSGAVAGRNLHVLARVAGRPHVRRPLGGGGDTVADGAEGTHVPADRRDRGGADDVSAGADRRRPQLGLPLLLAPRRDVRTRRAARERLRGRGPSVAELAAADRRRRPGRPPDHVRPRRRAAAARARAALADGVRGIEAGPGRQRRQHPVPAGRLRRGDGRPPPGAAAPHRAGRPVVGDPAPDARESRAALARAGRGDLGGSRAAAPLHPLEGDGVGRVRPRREGGGALRAGGRCRPLAGRTRRDPRRGAGAGLSTRSSARSSSTTAPSASTRAC